MTDDRPIINHDSGDEDRSADAYCLNCGDPAPSLDDTDWDGPAPSLNNTDWDGRVPSGTWRPCPNPSPGRPLVDCGVGGHMYTADRPVMS
jgi:hypothetical protein